MLTAQVFEDEVSEMTARCRCSDAKLKRSRIPT